MKWISTTLQCRRSDIHRQLINMIARKGGSSTASEADQPPALEGQQPRSSAIGCDQLEQSRRVPLPVTPSARQPTAALGHGQDGIRLPLAQDSAHIDTCSARLPLDIHALPFRVIQIRQSATNTLLVPGQQFAQQSTIPLISHDNIPPRQAHSAEVIWPLGTILSGPGGARLRSQRPAPRSPEVHRAT
jgi:hypothetical protein